MVSKKSKSRGAIERSRPGVKARALFPAPPDVKAALARLDEADRKLVVQYLVRIRASLFGFGIEVGRMSLLRRRESLLDEMERTLSASPGMTPTRAADIVAHGEQGANELQRTNTSVEALETWLRKQWIKRSRRSDHDPD